MINQFNLPRRYMLAGATAVLATPSIVRAQTADPIRLGTAMPLTGSQAGYGADFLTGMRMAVKDVNAQGGFAGRQMPNGLMPTLADGRILFTAVYISETNAFTFDRRQAARSRPRP